ncbi:hypothetical protein D3C75_1369090 [compost metagenome]
MDQIINRVDLPQRGGQGFRPVNVDILAVNLRPVLFLQPFDATRGGGNMMSLFNQVGD